METVCDMIGNAVPPQFALIAGKRIREELNNHRELLAQTR
jgi:site-specific DNA-cytosine methylase